MSNDTPVSNPATTQTISEQFNGLSMDGSTAPTASRPQLAIRDALEYIDKVKERFQGNQPEVYNEFLNVMKAFQTQQLDTTGVVERIVKLFEGHADLMRDFDKFLPPGSSTGAPTALQQHDGDEKGTSAGGPTDPDTTNPGDGQ